MTGRALAINIETAYWTERSLAMVTSPASDFVPDRLPSARFLLARQPILDRKQSLVAYELLFRRAQVESSNTVTSDLPSVACLFAHTAQLGLEKIIGDSLGFINADAEVLMSDIVNLLPRDKLVLQIIEAKKITPEINERISALAQQGFRFALSDDLVDSDDVQNLLPLIEIIKFDLSSIPLSSLLKLAAHCKRAGKKLLAEKVETNEQFKTCLDLGFDYFEGYYFAKPRIVAGRKLSPSQIAVMRLLSLITSDAENDEIEATIKRNVSLGLNLLRLVNSAAVGARQPVDSLSQALLILGRDQLRRWLQITLYAEPNKGGQVLTPLLILAATRGRLLELMAEKMNPGKRKAADTAFTVGIMSLMDALFGFPMHQILEEIAVAEEVREALLNRHGDCGELLLLAEYLERIDEAGALLPPLLERLGLSSDDVNQMAVSAFEWSNGISRTAG